MKTSEGIYSSLVSDIFKADTIKIISICLIRPSLAAAQSLDIDRIHMGRSPLGLLLPPAMENPRPEGPFCRVT